MIWESIYHGAAVAGTYAACGLGGVLFGLAIWYTLKFQAEKRAKAYRLALLEAAAVRIFQNLRALPQEGDVEGFAPETEDQIRLRRAYVVRRMTPEESAEARKEWGLQAEIDEMVGKVREGDARG